MIAIIFGGFRALRARGWHWLAAGLMVYGAAVFGNSLGYLVG